MQLRRKIGWLLAASLLIANLGTVPAGASEPGANIGGTNEGAAGQAAEQEQADNAAPPLGAVYAGASAWALDDLRKANGEGLLAAVQNLDLRGSITRAQFCRIVVRLYESMIGLEVPDVERNPFDDTDDPDVLKAFSLGIVNGTTENRFSPDELITREQLAAMLSRAAVKTGRPVPTGEPAAFADADQFAPYAVEAIAAMSAIEVVKGLAADTFGPRDNATVEQAVIMSLRLLERMTPQQSVDEEEPADGEE